MDFIFRNFRIIVTIIVLIGFCFLTMPFQSCEPKDNDNESDTCTKAPDSIVVPIEVYKPNIYIYPKERINLNVKIEFPKGGNVIKSIPLYENSWNVNVDKSGKIDNTYDYLFYESIQPDNWQYNTGWIINKDSLCRFFQVNMIEYGFNNNEIKDFTDYWIPIFNKFDYYLVYPQERKEIERLIQINFSIVPDNFLRLFYAVKGVTKKNEIKNHIIDKTFKRNGYYVTEWGVILK